MALTSPTSSRGRASCRCRWRATSCSRPAEAIAEAHSLGIVHRDLKPGNLFLTRRAEGSPLVKVLDFGISKATSGADMNMTRTTAVMGSPAYMSPEQMRSAKLVDMRTDIWAFGVILYQLVSGHACRSPPRRSPKLCLKVAMDPLPPLPAMQSAMPNGFERRGSASASRRSRRFGYSNVAEFLAFALAPVRDAAVGQRARAVDRPRPRRRRGQHRPWCRCSRWAAARTARSRAPRSAARPACCAAPARRRASSSVASASSRSAPSSASRWRWKSGSSNAQPKPATPLRIPRRRNRRRSHPIRRRSRPRRLRPRRRRAAAGGSRHDRRHHHRSRHPADAATAAGRAHPDGRRAQSAGHAQPAGHARSAGHARPVKPPVAPAATTATSKFDPLASPD